MTASDERADIQEAFFFYDKLGDGKIALTQVMAKEKSESQ